MTTDVDPFYKFVLGIVVVAVPAIVVSLAWQAISNPMDTLRVLGVIAMFVGFWLIGEITIRVHQRL